jgi:hypothetical protein
MDGCVFFVESKAGGKEKNELELLGIHQGCAAVKGCLSSSI